MVTVLHSFLFYLERIVPCRNLKPQTPTVRVYVADDLQVSRHASVCDVIYVPLPEQFGLSLVMKCVTAVSATLRT